ncbi:TPA: hypothetical protein ACWX1O_000127 [Elizabethkingia anophelis]|uniref:hypothetical protein n=1 Tax=Elizabethkingia anophelis TaxID=1117645 RepID=UPI00136EF4D6|nr:hypothetical protein [Elizabethkingia anophelis]
MTTKVITHQWTTKTYGQGNVDVKNCSFYGIDKTKNLVAWLRDFNIVEKSY